MHRNKACQSNFQNALCTIIITVGSFITLKFVPLSEKIKSVAESILTGIKTNNDTFPETGDLFIEKLIE